MVFFGLRLSILNLSIIDDWEIQWFKKFLSKSKTHIQGAFMNKKQIQIDQSKLLGFKILSTPASSSADISQKMGAKVGGVKPNPVKQATKPGFAI